MEKLKNNPIGDLRMEESSEDSKVCRFCGEEVKQFVDTEIISECCVDCRREQKINNLGVCRYCGKQQYDCGCCR